MPIVVLKSRPNLCECAEENNTVTHLDLSYNHLRRHGIKGIAKMLVVSFFLVNRARVRAFARALSVCV